MSSPFLLRLKAWFKSFWERHICADYPYEEDFLWDDDDYNC